MSQYYEKKYPEKGDYVMVKINEVNEDVGAYASLLEYDNIEGMIPINEFTTRRFKSLRVGRIEVVLVIDVDKEKGYLDLSKSKVSTDEVIKCENKWNRAKFVQTVMTSLSIKLSKELTDLHKEITWPLYSKYGSAYDAFLEYLKDANSVPEIDSFDNKFKSELGKTIKKRLEQSIYKFNSEIDVTCLKYEGIEAIRNSLNCVLEVYPSLSIVLITPPSFLISIKVQEKEKGYSIMNDVYDIIGKRIKEFGGDMSIKVPAYIL